MRLCKSFAFSLLLLPFPILASDTFRVTGTSYVPTVDSVRFDYCSYGNEEDCFFVKLSNEQLNNLFSGFLVKNQQGKNSGFDVSAELQGRSYEILPEKNTGAAIRINNFTDHYKTSSLEFDLIAFLHSKPDSDNPDGYPLKIDRTTFKMEGHVYDSFLRNRNRANNFGFQKSDCDFAKEVFSETTPLVKLLVTKINELDDHESYHDWRVKHFDEQFKLVRNKFEGGSYPNRNVYFMNYQNAVSSFLIETDLLAYDGYNLLKTQSEDSIQRVKSRISRFKASLSEFKTKCPTAFESLSQESLSK